jgi:hypothetical protein
MLVGEEQLGEEQLWRLLRIGAGSFLQHFHNLPQICDLQADFDFAIVCNSRHERKLYLGKFIIRWYLNGGKGRERRRR